MNKTKKKSSAINLILIIQLSVMLALSIGVTRTVINSTKINSIEHMKTIADERSHIIENYVRNAEKTLAAYSNAGEILNVITKPKDNDAITKAQEYTESFSNDVDNLEGIYVSEWNTHVLAHTDLGAVGMITRKDPDLLSELQNAMLAAGNDVYNTGIIISPASQKQIVSMYKAVYDKNGRPVGLVGLGIYTDGLVESLDSLTMQGMENAFYSMVNVSDNKYIFNADKEKVTTETDNSEILSLCKKYKNTQKDATDFFEYKIDSDKYISTYSFMADRGWLLMIDDTKSEIFALTKTLRVYMYIFCICGIGLIIFFHFINRKHQETTRKLSSAVQKNVKTKESLNTALFNDILTEVNNRISFSNEFKDGKAKGSPDFPYYFAMVNINSFSNVNINYGSDAGDMVLISTANRLRSSFEGYSIYRTGSDEFVIAMQMPNNENSYNKVITTTNKALMALLKPHETSSGNITVSYKMAIVKKSSDINSSIITALKDLTNRNGVTNTGQITFVDLDALH